MYIAAVPNRNSPPALLLRESYREGNRVKTRTLANLSKLPAEAIAVLRRVLKGETMVSVRDTFEAIRSFAHGHVQAVLLAMKQLAFAGLLASQPSPQRNLVQALVVARLLRPSSKLAIPRWWHLTSLPSVLDLADANEDHLYQAMDWLLERQPKIEKKLAARHLQEGGLALYDLTSSYFEGVSCPLAARGHDRDGKKGKLQVNWGLLTDSRGCPVAASVFQGNTGDPKTLLPEIQKVRRQFRIQRLVIVGDRGMITQKQIDELRGIEDLDWITALRPDSIKKLVASGSLQLGLFDERNVFELSHPDFPGERLVACRNPQLALRRAEKRKALIEATVKELERVRRMVGQGRLQGQEAIRRRVDSILGRYRIGPYYQVAIRDDGFDLQVDVKAMDAAAAAGETDAQRVKRRLQKNQRCREAIALQLERLRRRIERGRLYGKDKIGVRVGKVLNKYRVGKHFKLHIEDNAFHFEIDGPQVAAEAALDGLYVVRTSVSGQRMAAEEAVRSYKLLSQVERAIRSIKTVDLEVRPIRHHLEERVRAHIFLCMLAYYVHWHMLEAWRPLLFADEDQQAKLTRDPVAPAERSQAALRKVRSKRLEDGSEVHSFRTLLDLLGGMVRNVCRVRGLPDAPTFEMVTTPNAKQQRALDLLQTIEL